MYVCMCLFIYLLVATVLSIDSSTSLTGTDIYCLRSCRTPKRRRIGSHRLLSRWGIKGRLWPKIWDLPLGFIFLLTSWKYSSSEV